MSKVSKRISPEDFLNKELLRKNDGSVRVYIDPNDFENSKVIVPLLEFVEDNNLQDLQEMKKQIISHTDVGFQYEKYITETRTKDTDSNVKDFRKEGTN